MQPADRVGIDERRCLERTHSQRDVDLIAALFGDGLETVLGHLLDQPCDRIPVRMISVNIRLSRSYGPATPHRLSADASTV